MLLLSEACKLVLLAVLWLLIWIALPGEAGAAAPDGLAKGDEPRAVVALVALILSFGIAVTVVALVRSPRR